MTAVSEAMKPSHIEAFSGQAKQIGAKLATSKLNEFIVLGFERNPSIEIDILRECVESLILLTPGVIENRRQKLIEAILEAIVPTAPPEPHVLIEAEMVAEAKKAVLESGDLMTAAQVAQVAQLSTSNPSQQPNKWKREGAIFAVRHKSVDYFPSYALDPETNYRPLKAMAKVLERLPEKDAWNQAYWFAGANSFLGGRAPKDLLRTHPDRVIAAAEDEAAGVTHG